MHSAGGNRSSASAKADALLLCVLLVVEQVKVVMVLALRFLRLWVEAVLPNMGRYAAYAAGFYGKITRNLVVQVFYHKKLETFPP